MKTRSKSAGVTQKLCVVCERLLPAPKNPQAGGRPRRTCPGRCKYRADRRARLIAKLHRWQAIAEANGKAVWARHLAERIAAITQMPFTARPGKDNE
jgi:hypothetical protein